MTIYECKIHEPDPATISHPRDLADELIFDIACVHCGRSGSFVLYPDEVNW